MLLVLVGKLSRVSLWNRHLLEGNCRMLDYDMLLLLLLRMLIKSTSGNELQRSGVRIRRLVSLVNDHHASTRLIV